MRRRPGGHLSTNTPLHSLLFFILTINHINKSSTLSTELLVLHSFHTLIPKTASPPLVMKTTAIIAGVLATTAAAAPALVQGISAPIPYTSTYSVVARPKQVVNGTEPTGGLPGAIGYYDFGLNVDYNLICYHIRLNGFRGEYESPAATASKLCPPGLWIMTSLLTLRIAHLHEAARGQSGPPRIAFPNPKKTDGRHGRVSVGCLQGPFVTGLEDPETGEDYGADFHVSQIEENPKGFFSDVHSSLALAGAVRGQLA